MILSGQVYDNATGRGIPYASVQISDAAGSSFMGGVVADEYGLFYLDSTKLDASPYLYVTSVGYLPVLVDDDVYTASAQIGLDQAGDLPAVYVTPKSGNTNDWFMWVLFGGGLVLLLATARKEKKVSGLKVPTLSQNQWVDIALKIGIPIAIIFLVVKPILVALNLWPDAREQKQNDSDRAAADDQARLKVWNDADNHTYTQSTIDSIAVALRNDTSDWWGYEWKDLAYQLAFIPGFTVADAKYFLGAFVAKNGYTLYRWYFEEFEDALVFQSFDWGNVKWSPGWGGTGSPYDYSASYIKMGITEDKARLYNWTDVVNKFITYVYELTGTTKQ